jgi:hypothetical protein
MARSGHCAAGALSALALGLLTSACATATGPKDAAAAQVQAPRGRSGDMVAGGESGLGISGAETPPALKIVTAAPYALPSEVDCASLAREIAGLDALLGPDVDIVADPKAGTGLDDRAGQAFGSALRGAIPYRWALRWLTQAGDLDKQLRQAVMAGAARRGFLKGMRLAMACPVQVVPLLVPPSEISKDTGVVPGPATVPAPIQPALAKSAERKAPSSPR